VDEKTKQALKQKLSPQQYHVVVEKGTEAPFSGVWNAHFQPGTYRCVSCGEPLFEADSKFDAGCGWPSFDRALPGAVATQEDNSHGMRRTEILCARCGAHLGHVFNDGPTVTGIRHCVNSLSLDFEPTQEPASGQPRS